MNVLVTCCRVQVKQAKRELQNKKHEMSCSEKKQQQTNKKSLCYVRSNVNLFCWTFFNIFTYFITNVCLGGKNTIHLPHECMHELLCGQFTAAPLEFAVITQ